MKLSTKLFLLTFLFVALVIVGLYLKNQSKFKIGSTLTGTVPTTTPIQSDNPMGFPVDPETGTVLLPTGPQFSPSGMPNATAGGRLASINTCDQLQKIVSCYLEKAPKLAVGYEAFAKGDLYSDAPPAVRTTKCNDTITKLAETTRSESIKAGCIW